MHKKQRERWLLTVARVREAIEKWGPCSQRALHRMHWKLWKWTRQLMQIDSEARRDLVCTFQDAEFSIVHTDAEANVTISNHALNTGDRHVLTQDSDSVIRQGVTHVHFPRWHGGHLYVSTV